MGPLRRAPNDGKWRRFDCFAAFLRRFCDFGIVKSRVLVSFAYLVSFLILEKVVGFATFCMEKVAFHSESPLSTSSSSGQLERSRRSSRS